MPKRKREEQFTLGHLWRLLRWLHVTFRVYRRLLGNLPLPLFISAAAAHNSRYWQAPESFSCSADHRAEPAAPTSAAARPPTLPSSSPRRHHQPQIPCAFSPRLPPAARRAPSLLSTRSHSEPAPAPIARESHTPQNLASPPVSRPGPRPLPLFPSPPLTGSSPNAQSRKARTQSRPAKSRSGKTAPRSPASSSTGSPATRAETACRSRARNSSAPQTASHPPRIPPGKQTLHPECGR